VTTRTRIELPDTRGLVCAFRFQPDQHASHIGWSEIEDLAKGSTDGISWLHFNLTDVRACDWIRHFNRLPDAARETLLSTSEHICIHRVGDAFAGVFDDLHHDVDADLETIGLVRLYADESLLITGRRHPLRAIERLRKELEEGLIVGGTAALLARLLHHLGAIFESETLGLSQQIDSIEDRILAGHFHHEGGNLGKVRRLVSRLRRYLGAERHALRGIVGHLPPWFGEVGTTMLRQSIGRLDSVAQDLELLQERGHVLQDELAGRVSEATNRNLYLLSIITTVFLPISLITGIFGMNVGGLPWLQNSFGFWWVLLGMASIAAVVLLLLRWRRMF